MACVEDTKLASTAATEGASLVGVEGAGTVQDALEARGFRAANPLDSGLALTDSPDDVRSELSTFLGAVTGPVTISEGNYVVERPVKAPSGLDLRLDGELINTNVTTNISLLSSPLSLGAYHGSYSSDWTAGDPTPRYWGEFLDANYATWAILNTVAGTSGALAQVFSVSGPDPDGTGPLPPEKQHVDPVTGATVSNSGLFRYSTSPVGWERVGDAGNHFILVDATVVKGAIYQPETTVGDQFSLNGITVTLTGTTVAQAAADIVAAPISGVTAKVYDGFLRIDRLGGGTLTIANVSGTALVDLGLAEKTYTNNADAAVANLPVDALTIFLSREGDLTAIGATDDPNDPRIPPNGKGGVQHRPSCVEKLYLESKGTGPKRLTFDRLPLDHAQGAIIAGQDLMVTELDAPDGLHYYFLDNARITGTGGFHSKGNGHWGKSGTHRLMLDLDHTTATYGFGGNAHSDGSVRVRNVTCHRKAADLALASTRMSYQWQDLVVNSSDETSSGFVFNESSSLIKAEGMSLRWPNTTNGTGIQWSNATDCVLDVMLVDIPRQINSRPIEVGIALSANTFDIGGEYGVQRNETRVKRLRAGSPPYLIEFVGSTGATANLNVDNSVHVGWATGRPTKGAALISGNSVRPRLTGRYEYGDVVLESTVVDAHIDVQLDEGIVRGQTDANARFVRVNGHRQYPGAIYNPIDSTVGPVTPTPDCRTGQTGEMDFEHRFLYSAATGATVKAPTGTPIDGQTLTVNIKNTSGSPMTLAFNAVYEGLGTLANVAAGSRTIATFRYNGSWRCISLVQNSTALGPVIYSTEFSSDARWVLDPDCAIGGGSLVTIAAPDGNARVNTVSVPRLTVAREIIVNNQTVIIPGGTYQTTHSIIAVNAGGSTARVGGLASAVFDTVGTKTDQFTAGLDKTVGIGFNANADAGWKVSSFTVREL